jgi:hypothetical protein
MKLLTILIFLIAVWCSVLYGAQALVGWPPQDAEITAR